MTPLNPHDYGLKVQSWTVNDNYTVTFCTATRWQTVLYNLKRDWRLAGEIARGARSGWPD